MGATERLLANAFPTQWPNECSGSRHRKFSGTREKLRRRVLEGQRSSLSKAASPSRKTALTLASAVALDQIYRAIPASGSSITSG